MGWGKPKVRTYDRNGLKYVSTTQNISIIDKSAPLMGWAAKCTANHVEENFNDVVRELTIEEEVLLANLLKEAKKSRSQVSKQALQDGSDAHDLFDREAKGNGPGANELATFNEAVQTAYTNYLTFMATSGFVNLESEVEVFHDAIHSAGTCDRICRDPDGRIVLLDWKTSTAIFPEAEMQAVVYAKSWESMGREPLVIDRAMVVRTAKNQKFKWSRDVVEVPREAWDVHWSGYIAAQQLFKWKCIFS